MVHRDAVFEGAQRADDFERAFQDHEKPDLFVAPFEEHLARRHRAPACMGGDAIELGFGEPGEHLFAAVRVRVGGHGQMVCHESGQGAKDNWCPWYYPGPMPKDRAKWWSAIVELGSVPGSPEEVRSFLQRRIKLFVTTMFAIWLFALTVDTLIDAFTLPRMFSAELRTPTY